MEHSYQNYENMVVQVSTGLTEMEKLCGALEMDSSMQKLIKSREKLAHHRFSVGILGEFKRGKSTVINALLGKEIMPADILPTSATMNRVTYDMQPHAELLMMDGTIKQIPVEELRNYVTKLTKESEAAAAQVQEAVVYYPCQFCRNGVDIVDTPGLNDDERMTRITEEIIPKLDTIIMVLTYDSPLSMSEAEFVRNKILTSDISRLIFLVNKMDCVRREKDKERVLGEIKSKIQRAVSDKTAELFGEDSKEYRTAQQKLANVKVYPYSALDALEGKVDGDEELIAGSGTVEFEAMLERMLTEERGALELGVPLNLLLNTAQEAAKQAAARKESLELSAQEFEAQQKKALEEITAIRNRKAQEKLRIRQSTSQHKDSLNAVAKEFYPILEKRLHDCITGYQLDPKTLKTENGKKAACEALQKGLSGTMMNVLCNFDEVVQTKLRDILGEEALRLGEFMEGASQELTSQMAGFSTSKEGALSVLASAGVDGAVMMGTFIYTGAAIPGIGGMIEGFRLAGTKGAVVGGASATAASLAVGLLAGFAFSLYGLPLLILTTVSGTAVGKFVTKALFGGERAAEEIRQAALKSVDEMLADMKRSCQLENMISQRVDTVFEDLNNSLEAECEAMLEETQKNMFAIKEQLNKSKAERDRLRKHYNKCIEDAKTVLETLQPAAQKVFAVLAQN